MAPPANRNNARSGKLPVLPAYFDIVIQPWSFNETALVL
jgi:hypothetical protein